MTKLFNIGFSVVFGIIILGVIINAIDLIANIL